MEAFVVSKEYVIDSNRFYRRYAASPDDTISMKNAIVLVPGEARILKELSDKEKDTSTSSTTPSTTQQIQQSESTDTPPDMRGFREEAFLQWAPFPCCLGRTSTRFVDQTTLHMHHEPNPLPEQVRALRERKSDKHHFRIAVVNGFGSNLGDTVMGMTALRVVYRTLAAFLPSVSIDILLGADAGAANVDQILYDDCIDQVFFTGPTVEDFACYDAYFDFSHMITYPGYDTMPSIDWYLWWMGLDPAQVPAEEKRNRITIRWQEWHYVQNLLRQIDAPKKIFFNPKTSVALRSIPPAFVPQLVRRLLDADKTLHLILDQPLAFTHERIHSLEKEITSPERFKALVAQVDGMITANTFGTHVADAAGTPTVQLDPVHPNTRYPYYPYLANLNIPDCETLPSFMKSKTSTEEWEKIESLYIAAWEKLDIHHILQALDEKITIRTQAQEPQGLRLVTEPPVRSCVVKKGSERHFIRQRATSVWEKAQERLAFLGKHVLRSGATGVVVGGSGLTLKLAHCVGTTGVLHLFEPRRKQLQMIISDCVDAGLFLDAHPEIPVENHTDPQIPDTDPWSEMDPAQWGNVPRTFSITAKKLDDFALNQCRGIFIQPPMPIASVLAGAIETLRRCRPIVVFGPISQADAGAACKIALAAGYSFWGESVALDNSPSILNIIGIPDEKQATLNGFFKINIQ